MKELIKRLNLEIKNSDNIVFFGGAGVSTESGLKDFRSSEGIYNMNYKYPPEYLLSRSCFENECDKFFEFYREVILFDNIEPNITHYKLTELEKNGKLKAIITQNIDNLHQKAGSKNVIELHGSIMKNYCVKCNKFFDVGKIKNSFNIPKCECGGIIKPAVTLYEEALDYDAIDSAVKYISNADMLIIGGTSLTVYPASSLINYYKGNKLVLINKSKTPKDNHSNYLFNSSLGEVFSQIEIL